MPIRVAVGPEVHPFPVSSRYRWTAGPTATRETLCLLRARNEEPLEIAR